MTLKTITSRLSKIRRGGRLRAMILPCIAALLLLNAHAIAQDAAQPPPPASPPKQDQPSVTPPAEPPKTLDDLLGIEEDGTETGADEAAQKEADDELQRKLNEAELANNFAAAVEKMAISADLLDVRFDAGLGTQRVQEDILAKLDHLIDQAKKNQSRSRSSSSSSSSSSSQQQQQQNQQQDPGQQRNQQQPSQGDQRNNNPTDSGEGDPPAFQEGDVNTMLEESRSEWGNLPPRVRDQLLQGRREKFSSLYQQLTQEYYKRLAEEGTP